MGFHKKSEFTDPAYCRVLFFGGLSGQMKVLKTLKKRNTRPTDLAFLYLRKYTKQP